MLRKCQAGATDKTRVCTCGQVNPLEKIHAAGGFGRQSWIYGSPAVGDVTPKPERLCWEGKCAGRLLEEGSGGQPWIHTWGRDALEPVGPR